MDLRREAVADLAEQVRTGTLAARELVGHALERIVALNPKLNAFVAVDGDRAMEAAAAIDEVVAAGRDPGPLAGIPLAVKDLEDAEGFVTTCGSTTRAGEAPATSDSVLVGRLKAAGCVVVGKTNTPEFGWKADTENALFGRTLNPWHTGHVAGGSSGGSAAALASGMVALATGSDGGGSIRIPSSCCGLSGFKPSLGWVPTGGTRSPDWHELSTRGVMARHMEDVVAGLEVAVGPDPTDLRSLPRAQHPWGEVLAEPTLPARVVWSPTLGYAPLDHEVRAACERAIELIESLGVEVLEADHVFDHDPVDEWLCMTMVYNLRTLDEARRTPGWSQVDPILAAQVDSAAEHITALDLVRAEDACHDLNLRLVDIFSHSGLLLTPTCAAPPPPIALGGAGLINGVADYNWVRFTYPFNLTRSPAASVCVGRSSEGLPIGLQLVGPQLGDTTVIASALVLEAVMAFDEVAAGGS